MNIRTLHNLAKPTREQIKRLSNSTGMSLDWSKATLSSSKIKLQIMNSEGEWEDVKEVTNILSDDEMNKKIDRIISGGTIYVKE